MSLLSRRLDQSYSLQWFTVFSMPLRRPADQIHGESLFSFFLVIRCFFVYLNPSFPQSPSSLQNSLPQVSSFSLISFLTCYCRHRLRPAHQPPNPLPLVNSLVALPFSLRHSWLLPHSRTFSSFSPLATPSLAPFFSNYSVVLCLRLLALILTLLSSHSPSHLC